MENSKAGFKLKIYFLCTGCPKIVAYFGNYEKIEVFIKLWYVFGVFA